MMNSIQPGHARPVIATAEAETVGGRSLAASCRIGPGGCAVDAVRLRAAASVKSETGRLCLSAHGVC